LTLGTRTKLFLIALGLVILAIGGAYGILGATLDREVSRGAAVDGEARVSLLARTLAEGSLPGERAALDARARELGLLAGGRIALFDTIGELLADSHPSAGAIGAEARGMVRKARELGEPAARVIDGDVFAVAPFRTTGGESRIVLLSVAVPLGAAARVTPEGIASALVIALVLAALLAVLAARVLSKSARELTLLAQRMAAGDLDVRTATTAPDEFGELGRALDLLASSLSSTLGELREERDRLGGILSGMVEGVLLLDQSGRVVLLNPALREMLLLGTDAVGKTLLEAIRHADLKDLLDAAREAQEPVSREIELGGLKPRRLLVRVAKLPSEEQQLFAVFVDVTEVRKLESMRRDFVANVSHELRTPVTAIRSAAETLQVGLPEDRLVLEQFIGIIERNAARLHDLVEDLLDLSRIESQKLKLAMEPLELRAVFTQVLSLFKERADRKRIELVNEAEGGGPRVLADRRALEHVLTNLVDNAVKYCGPGNRVVFKGDDGGSMVRVLVVDNGPGIEGRHLPRLFERFYRVDAGRSRELGGTGLGLSIVKHLAEAMGGSVTVESAPGSGTTFVVSLRKAGPSSKRAVA
jgi:two-component system, OmpR family, phosphate regulon sensor histidine kinase PhoR